MIHWVESDPNKSGNKQPVPVHEVIDELLHRSAVSLLLTTDPYVLAVSAFYEEKDECKAGRGTPRERIAACKFENTQNAIQQVLDRHDSDVHRWALVLQARLLQERGEFESAIEAYRLGQVLYPTFAPVFFNEGYVYFVHKHYDKAIPLLRRAVKLDRTHASSRYYLAKALADRNSTEEAERYLHEVIGLGKSMEPLARMELGIIHHRHGNYSMATEELRESALLLPRNPDPFILWGCSLLDQGRSQEAARMFLAAREKQLDLVELYGSGKVESLILVRLIALHTIASMASSHPDEKASQRGIFGTCIPGSESQLWADPYVGH
jgi:tetratricopeptide (TPR) repeat protein